MKPIEPKINKQQPADSEIKMYTPAELIPEWSKSCLSDAENSLTTSFPSFDVVLKKKLRGTVGVYAGYGGTKKSLCALQSCRRSIFDNNRLIKADYWNLEMSTHQFISRLMNNSFKQEEDEPGYMPHLQYADFAENIIQSAYKLGQKELQTAESGFMQAFDRHFGDTLKIGRKSGLTVQEIYNDVKRKKERGQVLDIVAIDGLSMLDGEGFSETDRFGNVTKMLKEIANEFNIHVPIICHLSKGGNKHQREIMHLIRGSEKITDNMDFCIQFSLIVDPSKGTPKAPVYMTDKGWVRLYDKRGSGIIMDKIYDFDWKTLNMTESNEDPMSYETKEEKNGF